MADRITGGDAGSRVFALQLLHVTGEENALSQDQRTQRREQGSLKAMVNEPVYDSATRCHVLIRFFDKSVHYGVWNDKFRFLSARLGSVLLGSVLIGIIPQGSPLLGSDQANQPVYGDERLDPVIMPLMCPHGQSVDWAGAAGGSAGILAPRWR